MIDALAAIKQRSINSTVAISRASFLRRKLPAWMVLEAPVVDGLTVWDAIRPEVDVAVVEQPNWFGRKERTRPRGLEVLTLSWWGEPEGADYVVPIDPPLADVAVARNLAGRLQQIPGVILPHGQPEAPWFLATLPIDPRSVVAELVARGFHGCEALGLGYPEFPGGLRIQVAWPQSENPAIAAVVAAAVESGEKTQWRPLEST